MQNLRNNGLNDEFIMFSIGAKFVVIIAVLAIVSLGGITFLVSYMVSRDLELSARQENFEANRRAAREAEYALNGVYNNAMVLMRIMNAAGPASALSRRALDYYFENNNYIAAVVMPHASGQNTSFAINNNFFASRNIDARLAESYFDNNDAAFRRAAFGESVILNASPFFSAHLLALFYPLNDDYGSVSVLFSPEYLAENFSSSANNSYIINNDGQILLHSDLELVFSGASLGNREYVKRIRENPARSGQNLREAEGTRYYVAYAKLDAGACVVITAIEHEKIFEAVCAATRRNLYLTAAAVFLLILLVWFFCKPISAELKTLAAAARQIEGGNFDLDLKPKSSDEIGLLTTNFQRMSRALSVFGRFVNREIAIKAMRGELNSGGLPRHATIFFSNIRGFTEKSEIFTRDFGMDASGRIVIWLNQYFTEMADCVEKTNGVADKFIGDAVMAHWGTAYTAGNPAKDAFNAVKAALLMRKTLYQLNKRRRPGDTGDPPIIIGAGLNSGVVTAGQIGSEKRTEYTVIGEPVDLASRIGALNEAMGTDILISEDTWNLVKYFFICEEMPSVTVKGKEKPVRIFAVVNHVSVTHGPKTLAEVREMLGILPPDSGSFVENAEKKTGGKT